MKAIYPGTFDPVTNGHLDVIKRGLRLFDKLVVAVAENPAKKPVFSVNERIELVKECTKELKNVEVKGFDSLLVDFAKSEDSFVVLRGLRETSDFPNEFQHAVVNRLLDNEVETVFVMTSAENFYLTSSIVKEIASYSGNVNDFVPDFVAKKLQEKFRK